jgi:hypothetical protein
MFFEGIEPTAADADVVTHRYGQGVHHVCSFGVALLEELGQQREEPLPKTGLDGVDAAVETALAEYLFNVAVLMEKQAGFVDVRAEAG